MDGGNRVEHALPEVVTHLATDLEDGLRLEKLGELGLDLLESGVDIGKHPWPRDKGTGIRSTVPIVASIGPLTRGRLTPIIPKPGGERGWA